MAKSRRWTRGEDNIIGRVVTHYGYHSTVKALHNAGFTDRGLPNTIARCKKLGIGPGENENFIRAINVDNGDVRSPGKKRYTRQSVVSQAERDGVLKRVPYGPNGKTIPYVPTQWADEYVARVSKSTNGEAVSRNHVRRSWLPTKALPDHFGRSLRTIEKYIPAAIGDKESTQGSYRRSIRPYLDAIPKQRVGRAVYWHPHWVKQNAYAFKRLLPPVT